MQEFEGAWFYMKFLTTLDLGKKHTLFFACFKNRITYANSYERLPKAEVEVEEVAEATTILICSVVMPPNLSESDRRMALMSSNWNWPKGGQKTPRTCKQYKHISLTKEFEGLDPKTYS